MKKPLLNTQPLSENGLAMLAELARKDPNVMAFLLALKRPGKP